MAVLIGNSVTLPGTRAAEAMSLAWSLAITVVHGRTSAIAMVAPTCAEALVTRSAAVVALLLKDDGDCTCRRQEENDRQLGPMAPEKRATHHALAKVVDLIASELEIR